MFGIVILVATEARAEETDAREALGEAVRHYAGGDAATARILLLALLGRGPRLPPDVRIDTLAWLADVLFATSGEAPARDVLETLLDEAPDYLMDPFEHPPEVVAYLEDLRDQRRRAQLPPDPPPTVRREQPWPWTVLLPGGAYYWSVNRPVEGLVFGGLQIGGAAISVVTYAQIRDSEKRKTDGTESDARDLGAINRTASAVAYAAYVAPIVLETARWGTQRRARISVSANTITFTGTF